MPIIQNSEKDLKDIRKFIFDTFVKTGHAPVVEQIIEKFSLPRAMVEELLRTLEKKQMLVVQPSSNKILMLHPFSNIPTCWVVKTDTGKSYYANCAWDSVAMHFSLHQNVTIESYCLYCNTKISLRLEKGKFQQKIPQSTFIAISKPAAKWWDDIVDTCGNNMNYFCTEDHLLAWEKDHRIKPDDVGVFDDLSVTKLSELLYSTKSEYNYKRPTDEEERKMFIELNLVGSVWDDFST